MKFCKRAPLAVNVGVTILGLFFYGCGDDDKKTASATINNAEIYVSDGSAPSKILKYDGMGESASTHVSANLAWSQDVLFLEDDNVMLVSNLNGGTITRHNISNGEFIDNFASGIGGPTRMKIHNNLLYVLQWQGDGRVLRYRLDGTFVDKFTAVGVPACIGIDWDAQGNMYISSYTGKSVKKFDSNGQDMGFFVTGLSGPTNIWFDNEGRLVVNDWQADNVKRYRPDGKFDKIVITGISKPEGVALLDDGRVLIGSGGSHAVKMYDNNYKFISDFIAKGSGGLKTPNAVVVRKIN